MTTPEQHIAEIRTVTLTEAERLALRHKLHAYAISNAPAHSIPLRVWQWAGRHGVLALGIAVVVLAGGTGISASWAHPGDALYGFRLNVNDRVEGALVFDEDAQIDLEMRQMQRMIDGEDALRDEELSEVAFADDDDSFEGKLEFEDESDDTPRPTVSQTPDANDDEDEDANDNEDDDDVPEAFDDGSFERELRGIELELQAEDRAGLELEL